MNYVQKSLSIVLLGLCGLNSLAVLQASQTGKSPLDELPPHIRQVTHFGQRADWSHDGKRLLFLARTFGDAYEVELATGIIRPVTHHFFHEVDIYKLALDGSGRSERLNFFADYPGFKGSNPVVSDDGRYMAYQVAKKGDPAGVGRGILVFDLHAYERTKGQRE